MLKASSVVERTSSFSHSEASEAVVPVPKLLLWSILHQGPCFAYRERIYPHDRAAFRLCLQALSVERDPKIGGCTPMQRWFNKPGIDRMGREGGHGGAACL